MCYNTACAIKREGGTDIKLNEKRATILTVAVLSATYILAFLLRLLSVYIAEYAFVSYLSFYFYEIASSVLPLIASVSLFITYTERGMNKSLLRILFFVLTGLLYCAPTYAVDYAISGETVGYTVLITALKSLFSLVLDYLKYTVIFLVILFITRKIATAKKYNGYSVEKALLNDSPFDFSEPLNVAFFAGCLVIFVYNLVTEIIDTVNFIAEYSGIYQAGEIIYIIFRYIYILALLFLTQILIFLYKKIADFKT